MLAGPSNWIQWRHFLFLSGSLSPGRMDEQSARFRGMDFHPKSFTLVIQSACVCVCVLFDYFYLLKVAFYVYDGLGSRPKDEQANQPASQSAWQDRRWKRKRKCSGERERGRKLANHITHKPSPGGGNCCHLNI